MRVITLTYLDTHALNIIESVLQSLQVTSKSELVGHGISLEQGAIDVVVRWVAVDESVKEQGVEWETPIRRRPVVCVVRPLSPVVQYMLSGSVLIQVVAVELGVVLER